LGISEDAESAEEKAESGKRKRPGVGPGLFVSAAR
jgi:hypothetical protein